VTAEEPRPIALVTGGSRGIGAATAVLLAQRGWDVALTFRSEFDAATSVVAACAAFGGRAIAIQADLGQPADTVRMFSEVDAGLGTLRALINNAGIVAPKARVDEITVERLDHVFAVNVRGLFLCCGEAVRRMSTLHGGAGGVIVNVGSAASRIGGAGEYVDYAASKGAVDALTIGLSKEVAAEGIRVNCVRPGIVDTDIHASGGQPDRAARFAPLIPMLRPGQANEIATAIVWMCSEESSFTTGALLDVSGGR
jgi:NAD(P)-dependent dehydrogenase (short-subunit alcohol dehydrogenase family)